VPEFHWHHLVAWGKKMKVAVIGTGYVGLVTGVVLAELGNDVICVDNNPEKLAKIMKGESPIYEPGLEELMKKAIAEGFLTVSDSIADATSRSEVVFIAVGTPPGEDGTPDLTAVRAVAKEIGKAIKQQVVVVNKSTVPVGSGELVEQIILEQGAPAHLFNVVSNPEFLREGSAIHDTLHPDRIVIGAKKKEAAMRLVELYATLEAPMIITDLNSAELIKYASNSFLAMKISFINAISRVCELADANVADVSKGIGMDKRIGSQFLQAGLGWGGSCFPKDVLGMLTTAERYGYNFGLMQEVISINDDQTLHFVRRLEKRLNGLEGKRIGIMGLAFKPNTDDIRDAKSLIIVEDILKKGGLVSAYDPIATENFRQHFPNVDYKESVYDVSENADALVLVTEWNEFRQLDLNRLGNKMKTRILFDGRRVYKKDAAERNGFDYYTIGS
jgi:UDPglucose 6-dehydrogenase